MESKGQAELTDFHEFPFQAFWIWALLENYCVSSSHIFMENIEISMKNIENQTKLA